MHYRPFAPEPDHIRREDCHFYHTVNLPGHGVIGGEWDLRGCEEAYLGPAQMNGRTVFDVGPATGYLSFEMLGRGARVIALEWDDNADSDFGLIPYEDYHIRFGRTLQAMINERRRNIAAVRNSFVFSQNLLGLTVPIYVGDAVSTKPPMQADIAFMGCILLHLRDPIGAVFNIASAVTEVIIITELACGLPMDLDGPQRSLFWPSASSLSNVGTWWSLSPSTLREVLTIAGFKRFHLTPGVAFHAKDNANVHIFNLTAWR